MIPVFCCYHHWNALILICIHKKITDDQCQMHVYMDTLSDHTLFTCMYYAFINVSICLQSFFNNNNLGTYVYVMIKRSKMSGAIGLGHFTIYKCPHRIGLGHP